MERPAHADPSSAPEGSGDPAPAPGSRRGPLRSFGARVGGADPRALILCLAALAAAWAVVESAAMFPLLSDNDDEAVYLLQADALRNGHLFPPAPGEAEAFLPWLSGVSGDRFVTKYTPVYPALIAAAHLVTGSDRAALAVVAAAAVLTCYALAREVLGSRRQAVAAAAILLASPIVVVQSGTFLAYLPALALLQGFAAALLAGVRKGSLGLLALAGLVLGIALFARPYDSALFALPFGLWWLAVHRRAPGLLLRRSGLLLLGLAVPVGLMLAYSDAATGDALRPVFTFLEPADTLGFGERRMIPEGAYLRYGPGEAAAGMGRLLLLTGMWGFRGLALVALAVVGLVRRPSPLAAWLAGVAVAVPLGYAVFWGSWGSTIWGGPWRFGPNYYLPVFTPLAILGATGLHRIRLRDRALATSAVAGMASVSIVLLAVAYSSHRRHGLDRARLYAGPLAALEAEGPAIVFLPPLQGRWLLHPFALARNGSLEGPVLWAVDRGDRGNLAVLDEFPGRAPYRVTAERIEGARALPGGLNFDTGLEALWTATGPLVTPDVEVRNPTGLAELTVEVRSGGSTRSFLLDRASQRGRTYRVQLRLGPASAELVGDRIAETTRPGPVTPGRVLVSVVAAGPEDRRLVAARELAVRLRGAEVEVLLPGRPVAGRPGDGALRIGGPGSPGGQDAAGGAGR